MNAVGYSGADLSDWKEYQGVRGLGLGIREWGFGAEGEAARIVGGSPNPSLGLAVEERVRRPETQ